MENRLPVMILTKPAGFESRAHRLTLAAGIAHKHFVQGTESFRKVGEQFSGDFALVASRAKNARHQNPSLSFGVQGRFGLKISCQTNISRSINPQESRE